MLQKLFVQAPYAEDQPSAKPILIIHVLHRGYNAGALIGTIGTTLNAAFAYIATRPPYPDPIIARLVRSGSYGSFYGTAFMAVGLTMKMWGKEPIEWQDRSWRLLINEGQNHTDDWSIRGAGIGAVMSLIGRKARFGGLGRWSVLRAGFGGAGLGSALGIVGHVITTSRDVAEAESKVKAGEGPLKS
ncbi:MAG: hypothetical protein Q9190_003077 [Brigantiaea leucoxantha]